MVFKSIKKIERGFFYKFFSKSGHSKVGNFFTKKNNTTLSMPNKKILSLFFDKMTEDIFINKFPKNFFNTKKSGKLLEVNLIDSNGLENLKKANLELGLALTSKELSKVFDYFIFHDRNPSDAELMMYAQVNSEHCRHKIFNSDFTINSIAQDQSLFQMIKSSHNKTPEGTIVAYSDNAQS